MSDEKLIALNEPNKFLSVKVNYNLGGINYYTGNRDGRGYFLSVMPVTLADGMRSFIMFQGIKKFLLSVKRKSDKALAQAEALAVPETQKLVDYCLTTYKLTLADSEKLAA